MGLEEAAAVAAGGFLAGLVASHGLLALLEGGKGGAGHRQRLPEGRRMAERQTHGRGQDIFDR